MPDGLRRVLRAGLEELVYASEDGLHPVGRSLAELLASGIDELHDAVAGALEQAPFDGDVEVLPPVDHQEVWASGVTYERSVQARMEETVVADVYDLVYTAERPELFLKAPAWRVARPGAPLRVRADSEWDVPEPELALVITAAGEIAGYLIGDDLSSRSIEGANPLYLPQAKMFDDCLGLSETIVLARDVEDSVYDAEIRLTIERNGAVAFDGTTSTAKIRRPFDDLVDYLYRELSHPHGAILLTGTGLVPPDEFTLEHDDLVEISIDGVGSLRHTVYRSRGVDS